MVEIDLNDPLTFKPTSNGIIHVDIILKYAKCSGWIIKHRAPTFSFMKHSKKRYIVLVDRMLYSFKSSTPDTYKEFFEITKNTQAFATDKFAGELYCIEIRKMGLDDSNSWYLQAENSESMKMWLDNIKQTIAWIQRNDGNGTNLAYGKSSLLPTAEQDEYNSRTSSIASSHSTLSDFTNLTRHSSLSKRPYLSSSSSSQSMPIIIPPQLPPPKTQPPPIPSYAYL